MPYTYGWQSKRYRFGQFRIEETGAVEEAVQPGLPSRCLVVGSYSKGDGDHVKIVAKFGGSSELVLLNTANGTDNLSKELEFADFENLLPTSGTAEDEWYVSFRVEFTTNWVDVTPESADWPFVNNADVTLYCYWNNRNQAIEIRQEPITTTRVVNGVVVPNTDLDCVPLQGVQVVFYFADQTVRLRAATVISDRNGRIRTSLPTGKYNIEFYGGRIQREDWIYGYVVGAGDNLSPWKGTSTTGVTQAAEYNFIKAQFSTLYWPGYMIAEDFSPERLAYRDEEAETNSYTTNYAMQLYGRVFAGKSYVDFIGIAIDPPPE